MYDNMTLVYVDPTHLSDTPALHRWYCVECYFEFTAEDVEHCPACGSTEVHREH